MMQPENDHKLAFAQRLRSRRKQLDMSQEEVGDQLTASRQAYGKWEKGANQPGASDVAELASVLKVSADWLLTGKGPDPSLEQDEARLKIQELTEALARAREQINQLMTAAPERDGHQAEDPSSRMAAWSVQGKVWSALTCLSEASNGATDRELITHLKDRGWTVADSDAATLTELLLASGAAVLRDGRLHFSGHGRIGASFPPDLAQLSREAGRVLTQEVAPIAARGGPGAIRLCRVHTAHADDFYRQLWNSLPALPEDDGDQQVVMVLAVARTR